MSGILTGKRSVTVIFVYRLASLMSIFLFRSLFCNRRMYSHCTCAFCSISTTRCSENSRKMPWMSIPYKDYWYICYNAVLAYMQWPPLGIMSHGHRSSLPQYFARNIGFSCSLRLSPSSSPANYSSATSKLVFHSAWFEKLGWTFVNQFCSFRFCYMKWPWNSENWEVMLIWAFVVFLTNKICIFNCEVIDIWTIFDYLYI